MTATIRTLAEVGELDLSEVGGKARSLGVLAAAGFRVPGGFALTTNVLERFLALTGLAEERQAMDAQIADGELPDEARLAAFREAITAATFPDALAAEVREAMGTALPAVDHPVAVRSSGTREDLEGASFAGQYETYLNVRGVDAVLRSIQLCWASVWEHRVLDYAQNRAGGASGLQMCVVVQQMALADVSGVLFTVNPVSGREEEVLVESVFGLGEALVSGRVTADQFVVDAYTHAVTRETLADQAFAVRPTAQGTEEVTLDEPGARSLTDAQLAELGALAADIQEHYGRPMDVEFAFADGQLYVLQARPITTLSFAADIGEWTTADFRDGGVSSGVCSPFMWSLYDYALESSMPGYFKDIKLIPPEYEATWGRMFFARPYWNLGEVKKALMPLPDFDEAGFYADMGVEMEPGFVGRKTPLTVTGVLRALPTLFALNRNYKERLTWAERFVAEFPARKAPYDIAPSDIAALDRDTFVRRFGHLLRDLYRDTEAGYFSTIYNTSNSKTDLRPAFEKANAATGGKLDEPTLLGGLKDLSHLRPMKDMRRVVGALHAARKPLDDETVAEFAQRWRHHGKKELDIRVPRWVDDHDFVRAMLQSALDTYDPKADTDAMEQAHHQRYLDLRDEAVRALRFRPFLKRSFLSKLDLVRKYAWWREEMRDHSSFAYYLVRLWAVDAARRLVDEGAFAEPDDIWHLTWQDVLALFEGTLDHDEARTRIRAGRRLVRSFRNFDNPNEIGSHFAVPDAGERPEGALTGTPCSAGRVTARACVVRTLEEADKLQPGDILVTVFTDPGWTPLFSRIAGVVTETGGVLSHAAVISREYGIPAVLAVQGATRLIEDGQQITLDGLAGTVEPLED
ncbi:MAG: hypothetical protein EP330_01815 [Deltaproteobacteria bacterium]|nr:MAG: hypothetical protein EP330_01815 [Deltaproteobacteria bacterium]